jgi:hypothetical protein
MTKRFPAHPAHPERNCWGCDRYCARDSLVCGNGAERTQHPVELFGEDWLEWNLDSSLAKGPGASTDPGAPQADFPQDTACTVH